MSVLAEVARDAMLGKTGISQHKDPKTGDLDWLTYGQIQPCGWSILMYLAIALVFLNSFLLTKQTKLAIVSWRENLAPRLVFWPGILGALFAVTLAVFYWATALARSRPGP